ncbi:hypothetical protein ACHQM5_024546 [Ranunculus cassubicifolius]
MAKKWISPSLLLILSLSMAANAAVPAIYIFGDSLVDVGTNDYRQTIARADFPYNGIDFPGSKPTGRFSNGLNTADTLARQMGFSRSPPPYLSLLNNTNNLNSHIQLGINFASGGSGLLDTTGSSRYGSAVTLTEQVKQFNSVRKTIDRLQGENATNRFLSKSIFITSVGSNDIMDFYDSNNSSTLNKQDYVNTLISAYEKHLRRLYSLGARKFGVISVPPIGCCPYYRAENPKSGCLEDLNKYARIFHSSLKTLLKEIRREFKDVKYSLGNAYEMVKSFMDNPLPFGFKEVKTACCGNGTYNGHSPCLPDAHLCSNRHEYLFWDLYHPTQAAAELAALTLYGGSKEFATPINFRELARL